MPSDRMGKKTNNAAIFGGKMRRLCEKHTVNKTDRKAFLMYRTTLKRKALQILPSIYKLFDRINLLNIMAVNKKNYRIEDRNSSETCCGFPVTFELCACLLRFSNDSQISLLGRTSTLEKLRVIGSGLLLPPPPPPPGYFTRYRDTNRLV